MLECVENSIKVIVVGDGNVGKTSMLRRFVKGEFVNQYKKTIGAEFMEKNVFLRQSNTTVKLMLWDTAGQEVFNSLTQAYYRGAGAAIVAFSTVDKDSFMNVENWKKNVENVCGSISMVLCQTKFDLAHEAAVTNEEAEQLAIQLQLPFFRVSTKDDFNVTQLFEYTASMCLNEEPARNSTASGKTSSNPNNNEIHAANAKSQGTQSVRPVDLREPKKGKKKSKKKLCTLL
ncbi:small G-protein, putative [Trypanosoma cruzi marinkellei]|uniref:Small G-protein, putative n=1 Tax=Trypanosoma cruzi marinkellei TaxID=85056 RepID=K2MBZ0_TRYCR|nr:small G-protein, putative [Trypanosoma cruzi marinkellei]